MDTSTGKLLEFLVSFSFWNGSMYRLALRVSVAISPVYLLFFSDRICRLPVPAHDPKNLFLEGLTRNMRRGLRAMWMSHAVVQPSEGYFYCMIFIQLCPSVLIRKYFILLLPKNKP